VQGLLRNNCPCLNCDLVSAKERREVIITEMSADAVIALKEMPGFHSVQNWQTEDKCLSSHRHLKSALSIDCFKAALRL